MIEPGCNVLFESSWEVCNRVGGIYTVVKSKADILKKLYSHYFLIGPYIENQAINELKEMEPPSEMLDVFSRLKMKGIVCYFGKWLIKGEPLTILIDFRGRYGEAGRIKKELWDNYNVDSINAKWDFDEPVIWSEAVGMLIEEMSKKWHDRRIVGHFHEWLAGSSILYLKSRKSKVATVFTTHATMLGRSISGAGRDLYDEMDRIEPMGAARDIGIIEKHTSEKAAAAACDIFTTVSHTTAVEAEKFLGRRPEVLVLNGLDFSEYPNFIQASVNHAKYRDMLREFLVYYFFPHYWFDLNNTLLYFISGRNEFHNKGVDITIEALAKLNEILKREESDKHVAVFFFIPNETHGIKKELLENRTFYSQIKNFSASNYNQIQNNILDQLFTSGDVKRDVLPDGFTRNLIRHLSSFKRDGLPGYCTHYLPDEEKDPIITNFKKYGLLNRKQDRVKVINYPVYLEGADGLLDYKYSEIISGCHLGLFPSYYEPWGYTPLESAALGVCAVTSDTAGFGRFIQSQPGYDSKGIFVLNREKPNAEETVEDFTALLYEYTMKNHNQRAQNKIRAMELASEADWNKLVENYITAHNKAYENMNS